jgi:hypothetical protein
MFVNNQYNNKSTTTTSGYPTAPYQNLSGLSNNLLGAPTTSTVSPSNASYTNPLAANQAQAAAALQYTNPSTGTGYPQVQQLSGIPGYSPTSPSSVSSSLLNQQYGNGTNSNSVLAQQYSNNLALQQSQFAAQQQATNMTNATMQQQANSADANQAMVIGNQIQVDARKNAQDVNDMNHAEATSEFSTIQQAGMDKDQATHKGTQSWTKYIEG